MTSKYKAFKTTFAEDGSASSIVELKPIEDISVFFYIDFKEAMEEYYAIEEFMGRKFLPVEKEPRDIQDEFIQRFTHNMKGIHKLAERRLTAFPNKDDLEYWQHLKKIN